MSCDQLLFLALVGWPGNVSDPLYVCLFIPPQLDHVPMSQVGGLVLIQQQLERLSVHRTLRTLHELLEKAAEEKRSADYIGSAESASPKSPANSVDGWRLAATTKLAGTRWVWSRGRWVWSGMGGCEMGWCCQGVWQGERVGVARGCGKGTGWVGVARGLGGGCGQGNFMDMASGVGYVS